MNRLKVAIPLLAILVIPIFLLVQNAFTVESSTYTNPDVGNNTSKLYVNKYEYGANNKNWIPANELDKTNLEPGTYEVTRYPHAEPTPEQLQEAWELYNQTYENAEEKGWFNIENAYSDGYQDWLDPIHYPNKRFKTDGQMLNPEKPEYLIYKETSKPEDHLLVGVMFLASDFNETMPQLGGPLTIPHYHKFAASLCYEEGVLRSTNINECESPQYVSPQMYHVWFIKRSEGPFSTSMRLSDEITKDDLDKLNRTEFINYALQSH